MAPSSSPAGSHGEATPPSSPPYLVALALVELGGRRALPLAGKSRRPQSMAEEEVPDGTDPGEEGRSLALELLLRLWQRSDEGALRPAAGCSGLLLAEMPLEALSERLPVLKAAWLASGDAEAFRTGLRELAPRAWTVSIARYEPVRFTPCP